MFDTTRIKTLDVFSFDVKGEPKGLGFVINGIPYMLWTHVYQNLEMSQQHSVQLLKRLDEGIHFISIPHREMLEIKTRYNAALFQVHNASVYHFVTEEGFNRAIMEVDTSGMKNKKIAAAIEKRKDEMAHIFTEYKNGTLALPAGKKEVAPRKRALSGPALALAHYRFAKMYTDMYHLDPYHMKRKASEFSSKPEYRDRDPGEVWFEYINPDYRMDEEIYTVTDLKEMYGYPSPQALNKELEKAGLQYTNKHNFWKPTKKGLRYSYFRVGEGESKNHMHLCWKEDVMQVLGAKKIAKSQRRLSTGQKKLN